MVNRFGYRLVMAPGLAMVGVSLLVLTHLELGTSLWLILVLFFMFGFGMGNVIAPASTVMQNVLPINRVGAGSAVQNTVRQVFGAFGVAVVGTLLATRYATNLLPSLTDLPAPMRGQASQSVILTMEALQRAGLPPEQAAKVQSAAFNSFLDAAHVATWVSTGVIIVATLVVWFLLPQINPPSKRASAGDKDTAAAPAAAH
jgi:MFS family permease